MASQLQGRRGTARASLVLWTLAAAAWTLLHVGLPVDSSLLAWLHRPPPSPPLPPEEKTGSGGRRGEGLGTRVEGSRRSALSAATAGGAAALLLGAAGPDVAVAVSRSTDEKLTTQIFRDSTPGVVSVARRIQPQGAPREEDGLPKAVGSGFVWDKRHVVTNYHVVKELKDEQMLLIFTGIGSKGKGSAKVASPTDDPPERQVLQGQLVGFDQALDVAVLKVVPFIGENTSEILHPLPRGSSSDLEVGQTVYAIGNPFGLEHSMSKGIISGISRTFNEGGRPIRGCIQTDASINPGNSGGPLLDSAGKVIGVNTAIITGVGGTFAGVGLATPMDTVSKNVMAIIDKGFVNRAFLGITFARDLVSEQLRLPGVVVVAVVPGSPADKAGVQPMRNGVLGDVVVAVDGKPTRTGGDFFRQLDKHLPGESVQFVVQRKRPGSDDQVERVTLSATLSTTRD
eukprot:TRINITY_DN81088_c0_g1_i1.p1 TRINITY_DN81088_c0_g1~~TRINITY_DN81088_c0_g1_i1.p1  ORF type:complete len:456 (-),score=62.06 TRINITY_DN81088_c0_g1_i1:55-1422(-)